MASGTSKRRAGQKARVKQPKGYLIESRRGAEIALGDFVLTVPKDAVRRDVRVSVTALPATAIPGGKADGRNVVGLWRIEVTPPTALNLAATVTFAGDTDGPSEFRYHEGVEPLPTQWIPLGGQHVSNDTLESRTSYLPPAGRRPGAVNVAYICVVPRVPARCRTRRGGPPTRRPGRTGP